MTREEAIKQLKELQRQARHTISTIEPLEAINMAIKALEQEPKTGQWIYHRDWDKDGECPYECSECGRANDYKMNYCGYCGIKMEV